MDYLIVFEPELGIDPESFVAAWNQEPDCQVVTTARLERGQATSYGFDVLALLGAVALELGGAALYDLIKHVVAQHKGILTQSLELIEIEQPDGTRVLAVRLAK